MSTSRISPTYTVQPASSTKMPKSLYIVAFALSTLAAYRWGSAGTPEISAPQAVTSTAFVDIRDAADAAKPDPAQVRRQILAKDEPAAADAAARLREKTAVDVIAKATPGATRIAIRSTDKDPRAAAQWVNGLANAYAETYRQQWQSRVAKTYQDVQAATGRADEQLRQATARLDAFVNEQLRRSRQRAFEAANPPPVPAVHPARVDNPDWVALNRQLSALQQHRAKLLVDRTPLHPEVQETELRIAEAQRRLAETERWIPARQGSDVSAPPLAADRASTAASVTPRATPELDPAVTQAALDKLKGAVAAAHRASELSARRERDAWQAGQHPPKVDVQWAVALEAPPPSTALRLRLALAALAAGLTATVGLGMVVTGAAIEPALRSATQIQTILALPVLGIVPETDPARAARSRRPNLLRLLWIVTGLIVIASCVAAVLLRGR